MPTKAPRASNLELLRIVCMLLIIGDHLTGQGGIADYSSLPSSFVFSLIGCGSRIACTVFVLVGSWFMCEQPFKTRRPLSLWLSLWLYTVPVTLLCRLAGLDVSLGALRWAAFPAGTRQLWFISDYLVLLLCVPLLNRLLRGLPRRYRSPPRRRSRSSSSSARQNLPHRRQSPPRSRSPGSPRRPRSSSASRRARSRSWRAVRPPIRWRRGARARPTVICRSPA